MARAPSSRAFERVINLAIAKVQPPELQKLHAKIARDGLAQHLATVPSRPNVRRIVDGRLGAAEESVRPFGVIRYEFDSLREAALFALDELRRLSPIESGDYRKAWFLLYQGKQVTPEALPPDAREVTVTNDQPYSRMLAVGKRADGRPFSLQNVAPGYMELAWQAVRQRFGNSVTIAIGFIQLEGGYVMKQTYRDTRRDRAGQQITYPSLVLSLR
ncbi:hypothetical protein [Falsiroseomonas sp.]|uniref:hypothetical protein n=1 Tax=Falsiroseomonas sp. TaxID=2870721 RepID=UPI0027353435|nr:hypothetical protein [Falsiroseomonas sp.]MDP3417854.1 hypothetical protein [Falsiroseomonas sp.]